jgi:hypothetical protein
MCFKPVEYYTNTYINISDKKIYKWKKQTAYYETALPDKAILVTLPYMWKCIWTRYDDKATFSSITEYQIQDCSSIREILEAHGCLKFSWNQQKFQTKFTIL